MRIVSPPEGAGWAGGDEYLQSLNEMLKIIELENSHDVCWYRNQNLFPKWLKLVPGVIGIDKVLRKVFYSNLGYNIPLPMTKFTRNSFFWIPDLQDLESPEMFTEKQILQRQNLRKNAIARKYVIYFSSEHAMKIFSDLQPSPKSYGLLRFSTSPEKLKDYALSPLTCHDCREKGYFYLPNQWWKHKNHIRTLSAFIQYRANGGKLHLVLSGKREDYRWPDYYKSVETMINSCNQDIHDLGFLDRNAQLSVLFAAKIVLQTSLYEGWSTTVEESLVSGKVLVVSSLPVFVEQGEGERNIIFVDPHSLDSIVQGMCVAENFEPAPRDLYWRWNRFEKDFKELLRSATGDRI